jgi:hypothetical protein
MGGLCQVGNQPDKNFCNELITDENLESSFENPTLNAVMTWISIKSTGKFTSISFRININD